MKMKIITKSLGFTLMEVLIALVILAIALTSLIVITSESTRNTKHLQDKVTANWLAQNLMAQVRMGLIEPPRLPKHLQGKSNMLKQQWHWVIQRRPTNDKYTDRISIRVGTKENNALIYMTGFRGVYGNK